MVPKGNANLSLMPDVLTTWSQAVRLALIVRPLKANTYIAASSTASAAECCCKRTRLMSVHVNVCICLWELVPMPGFWGYQRYDPLALCSQMGGEHNE